MTSKKTRPEDILSEIAKKYQDFQRKRSIYSGIVGVKMMFYIVSLNYLAKRVV